MENLLRTYREQELNELFEAAGFPEVAKQYCIEKYNEKYIENRKNDIDEEEYRKGKDALSEYLKEACCWNVDTLREHAWEVALEDMNVDAYIHQRELGHGHEWSKLFCDKMVEHNLKENDALTYSHTYDALKVLRIAEECIMDRFGVVLKRKKDTLSDREIILAVKNLAKGEGEIAENFIMYCICSFHKVSIEDLFQDAKLFKKLYNEIVAEGHAPEDAFDYALDLWYEYVDATFSIAYREAMKHKEPHAKAWNFAKFCSETDINQHWAFIGERDLVDFPETWQREIIADFKIKDAGEGWSNYVNEIRQSLGLEPQ